ncbi:DUF1501 domain-containing protein [Fimbriiglobus ruber]|uniref:Sulfatase n=1 Tax=Fimbriiglobus ruber TaxID=1908690 RepID=A0A225DNX1_9BACT|nr:DUF1501 domain-containing protein [Fimbriiglobus ruber]OWK37857.1 hypothetical protein FRUB_06977 [Fimbriiglobus ruber]
MHRFPTRRDMLHSGTFGVGTVALAWLLNRDKLLAAPVKPELERKQFDLTPKVPHFAPKAKAMISLFMQGGPSHMDLLDPKPALEKYDGKPFPGTIKYDNAAQASSKVLASPWKFKKHGKSGIDVSELLPHTAGVIDDVCVVRSMHTGVNNHVQGIHALNTGRTVSGHPVLGSWICYALGSEAQNLPAFVALPDPVSLPVSTTEHWANGWLPAVYQGTSVRPREPRILNLDPPPHYQGEPQQKLLGYLNDLNRDHRAGHPGELDLDARIGTYALAARMQTAAKEALDLSKETTATKTMYGLDDPATADYGTRCLIARRMVERGVRFVQVFTQNQFWDHHGSIRTGLPAACKKTDQPAAALVKDLKQRGLLDSTLVMWGGEMGRLPVIQNDAGAAKVGRDHNTYGFTLWFAGGGFKAGHVHGATDEFGHHAVENVVTQHDLHATLLHLFGLDAKKLTYARNGAELNLLDGHEGKVVKAVLR